MILLSIDPARFFELMVEGLMASNKSNRLFLAVAYLAMSVMAQEETINYSVLSLINLGNLSAMTFLTHSFELNTASGKYRDDIYILTDSPVCFAGLSHQFSQIHVIELPPANSIVKIKALKTQLFNFLPAHKRHILYLDIDIIITRSLDLFVIDLNKLSKRERLNIGPPKTESNMSISISSRLPTFDFGAFYDASGHYVGFCSGCEKWHTGK
jgi:hypothetical protein